MDNDITSKQYADQFWELYRSSNHRRPKEQEIKYIARAAFEAGVEQATERAKAHLESVMKGEVK